MVLFYPPLLQSSVGPKDTKVKYTHLSQSLSLLPLPNYFHPFLPLIKLRLSKDTISC